MVKKLIALSVLLLLPVSFISSASAASKSITCYKGTASKVVKGSNPKCAKGWSTKKPSSAIVVGNDSKNTYKVQGISPSEALLITDSVNKLQSFSYAQTLGESNCLYEAEKSKSAASGSNRVIEISKNSIKISNEKISLYKQSLTKPNLSETDKNRLQLEIDNALKSISTAEIRISEEQIKLSKYSPSINCHDIYTEMYQYQIDEYLPTKGSPGLKAVTEKLLNNFCGLNQSLLEDSYKILSKSDPMIGYEKYRESVMKPLNISLNQILSNRSKSINTDSTDSYLTFVYPDANISYNSLQYKSEYWDNKLSRGEYGTTVSNKDFEALRDGIKKTLSFCKNR